jgi:hypothetical protein
MKCFRLATVTLVLLSTLPLAAGAGEDKAKPPARAPAPGDDPLAPPSNSNSGPRPDRPRTALP